MFAIVLLTIAISSPAKGELSPGGALLIGRGKKKTNCYVATEVLGRRQLGGDVPYYPVKVRGRDGVVQKSCGDECEFNLRLCANVTTPKCTPTEIVDLEVFGATGVDRPDLPVAMHECGPSFTPVSVELAPGDRKVTRRLTVKATRNGQDKSSDDDFVKLVCRRSSRECCGDGKQQPGEDCDEGNHPDGVRCNTNCRHPGCGDGIKVPGEQCDDGNRTNGDGCDDDKVNHGNCTDSKCGNGVVAPDEKCDPGVKDSCDPGQVCSAACDKCEEIMQCQCFDSTSQRLADDNVLTMAIAAPGTAPVQCGSAKDGSVPPIEKIPLKCGQLYVGGGPSDSVPKQPVEPLASVRTTATCDGPMLRLSDPADQTAKGCTEEGCLVAKIYDGPGAILCTLVSFSGASVVTGSVNCATWDASVTLPLKADVYLNGCPDCSQAVHVSECVGNGPQLLGTVYFPDFVLKTGKDELSDLSGQFAGYCQNAMGDFSNPLRQCPATPCEPSFPICVQRFPGAFGDGSIRSIELQGSVPGNLGDGVAHIARLVEIFPIPPSSAIEVNQQASLPGPGAVGLEVSLQLQSVP